MSPRDPVFVGHMLDMARKAVAKAAGVTSDMYEGDENLRLALTHLVQVIGEAGRHVSRELRDEHPEIPWQEIVGMRHRSFAKRTSASTGTSAGIVANQYFVGSGSPWGHSTNSRSSHPTRTRELTSSGLRRVAWPG